MSKTLLTKLMMQAPYQPATNYWRAFEIGEVIQYGLPSGKGLDLGCGDGHLMGIILDAVGARDLIGLDIDPQETEIARARHIYREVLTVPADTIPFSDATFDYVFSNSVLEHIENIGGVLREVGRVLRPGGRFLFTVPGPDFHSSLDAPRSGDPEAYLREVDARCAHLRYWNLSQWQEALTKANLLVVNSHEYLTESQVQRWDTIARYTSGILRRLARKKKRPIEIQRMLRLRSSRVRLPRPVAAGLATVMQLAPSHARARYGCLLIDAKRG